MEAARSRLMAPSFDAVAIRTNIISGIVVGIIAFPLSIALALLILGALGWAVWRGQFDDVDAEGERILRSD